MKCKIKLSGLKSEIHHVSYVKDRAISGKKRDSKTLKGDICLDPYETKNLEPQVTLSFHC